MIEGTAPRQSPRNLRLLHVTDPHLFAADDAELYGVRTWSSFLAVLAHARAIERDGYDALLLTGDVAEEATPRCYERVRDVLVAAGMPVLCIPGNHEDRALMAAVLGQAPLQFCGSIALGAWRVVMLDTHVPGEVHGHLDAGELARLEHELASVGPSGHALVCLHHQPIPMGSPWLDALGLDNADELLAVLDRHDCVRGVLWGHVHQASDRRRGGVQMMSTPSTCAQFTPGTERCVMDLRPPGFRRLELTPSGRIDGGVEWLPDWQPSDRPPDTRQG
jgi:Icc protein